MVEKPYMWANGAKLEEHSKRKHKILREYFARYLAVRCQLPQQAKFRLAIVDGFSGGGRYSCGSPGSPIIFLEELRSAVEKFNLKRCDEGMSALDIECLLVLNDEDPTAIESVRECAQPLIAAVKAEVPRLHIQIEYLNSQFENVYPNIKDMLQRGRYRNVLFALDQCGHSSVNCRTIIEVMQSFNSAEIFYTFSIQAFLAFLARTNPTLLASQFGFLGIDPRDMSRMNGMMNNKAWLGAAEITVFETLKECAPYVSPFSINNPDGWRYWFIHFANSHRARQEYNNVLHQNASMQAHFGRSGLDMLSYDPTDVEASLYLFDQSGREVAKQQLLEDVPRTVSEFGDAVRVEEFYASIYNLTPAHADDIHAAIIESPDIEVITEHGGERRKANTIDSGDILRMRKQRSFFPIFFSDPPGRKSS